MKVNIKDIETITLQILTKLKDSKGNEIEFNNDYYWDIQEEELYNPYEIPKNMTLGQLSDDLNELNRLNKFDEAIAYDLKRIAMILRALSFENQADL